MENVCRTREKTDEEGEKMENMWWNNMEWVDD
eukprot:CAMPEP_0172497050 /NCGR_PEP_ID=MMETSP1066-20121228/94771_1 /TAXON_ID=671091 /ORGANISM="Coscinodiscus wailesii, Strain CCMP2513" /LENGTH=31 /DNA_ID= /DNA_START= /DNA_END= /DNA_ORIENTATION=